MFNTFLLKKLENRKKQVIYCKKKFCAFALTKLKNTYLDQRLECTAPKHWSKYTTGVASLGVSRTITQIVRKTLFFIKPAVDGSC